MTARITGDQEAALDSSAEGGGVHARLAVAVSGLAAVLGIGGALLPVVGPDHAPAFSSLALLAFLAVLPPVGAGFAVWRGWGGAGMGLLVAVATFAPGRLVADLQLAVDVSTSQRPELVVPTSLAPLDAGPGLWMLVAGHGAAMLAGLVAARSLLARYGALTGAAPGTFGAWDTAGTPPDGLADDTLPDDDLPEDGSPVGAGGFRRQPVFAVTLCLGMAAAMGLLFGPPYRSGNAFLLDRTLLGQPGLAATGGLLLVCAAVLVPVWAAAGVDPRHRAGTTVGAAIGLLSVALPDLVSSLAVGYLRPGWGACLVLAVVVGLGFAAKRMLAGRVSVARSDGEPA